MKNCCHSQVVKKDFLRNLAWIDFVMRNFGSRVGKLRVRGRLRGWDCRSFASRYSSLQFPFPSIFSNSYKTSKIKYSSYLVFLGVV